MIGNFENPNLWEVLPEGITVDSGAAETVLPAEAAKHYECKPTEDSEAGYEWQSATGEPIPNLGEKTDMKGGKVKTLFQSLSSNALPNTRKSRAPGISSRIRIWIR